MSARKISCSSDTPSGARCTEVSANGTRANSACTPSIRCPKIHPIPPTASQWAAIPALHGPQRPQDVIAGTSTRSPCFNDETAAPVSTTVPTASCPRMRPSVTAGTSPLRMCRSVPQIVVVSTLTITSVGSWMPGSSTLSQDRWPAPPYTSALMPRYVITRALPRRFRVGTYPPMVPDESREWLEAMLLIRRFEERAGAMYAKNKVGGFLHLAIGEEATIVGAVRAMRAEDYLISTYRSHGHALARGTDPKRVMAELFGKATGVSGGRGGSMHMFDAERRFMGGYGIVGGNLPLAAGIALSSDYRETEEVTVCVFGDGAANQGTFGETLNLAALWKLPVVFMVTNNQFGMGTALERHSAQTDLHKRGEGYGVAGLRCDGMDINDTYTVMQEAIEKVRSERTPILVEAVTYRFRGHSMADPEEYRTKEQVEHWRERDPVKHFAEQLDADLDELDGRVTKRIDDAVQFAEDSDFPPPESIYENLYV